MTNTFLLRPAAAVIFFASMLAACGDSHPRTAEVCTGTQALRVPRSSQSQCGATADFTPINAYRGDIADVQVREDAVTLVNGDCTGTLIAAVAGPVVLTAGHCVGLGDQELIEFNYEEQPDGDPLIT